jgi:hypothetical protein
MNIPTIRIHNTETGEVLDREMTDVEFAKYQADEIEALQLKAEAEAKATQRQAILDRLGLTSEEARLLLS